MFLSIRKSEGPIIAFACILQTSCYEPPCSQIFYVKASQHHLAIKNQ